jgi:hypothetical protein
LTGTAPPNQPDYEIGLDGEHVWTFSRDNAVALHAALGAALALPPGRAADGRWAGLYRSHGQDRSFDADSLDEACWALAEIADRGLGGVLEVRRPDGGVEMDYAAWDRWRTATWTKGGTDGEAADGG